MIDEEHLRRLCFPKRPPWQVTFGGFYLMPNFNLPPVTRIELTGLENLPSHQRVIFALNHTDRYNYFPFQYKLWRCGQPFTTTWVKAKYYENRWIARFFDHCNNIPLPSRGYLILQDAFALLGRKLSDQEYRRLRDSAEGRLQREEAIASSSADVRRLLTEARRDFQPEQESYASYMQRWNDRLMSWVERRTLDALSNDNNLIVFPQGTRSKRLLPGKSGLAQFALRHEVPVVPVASMGSENVYPGASPWARGGLCRYLIGKPMSVKDVLADCRIDAPYTPFSREAEVYSDCFERATRHISAAINELLDEPYKMAEAGDEGESDSRSRADRLI